MLETLPMTCEVSATSTRVNVRVGASGLALTPLQAVELAQRITSAALEVSSASKLGACDKCGGLGQLAGHACDSCDSCRVLL